MIEFSEGRDVWQQRSAEVNIRYLQSTANSQQWKFIFFRVVQDFEFKFIPAFIYLLAKFQVFCFIVETRMHVLTTGQKYAITICYTFQIIFMMTQPYHFHILFSRDPPV